MDLLVCFLLLCDYVIGCLQNALLISEGTALHGHRKANQTVP